MKWIVTQIGAREHYSVPRAFDQRGQLFRFYTDVWCRYGASWARKLPGPASALGNRYHRALPGEKVTAFNWMTARQAIRKIRRGPYTSMRDRYEDYDAIGRAFALAVNRHLRSQRLDPADCAGFLFSTGALETAAMLREMKIPVIVDQLDPARLDEKMVRAEIEKWPGWEDLPGEIPESYYQRLAEEWRLADLVLVNSKWSARNLREEGIAQSKIIVVPLCYEKETASRAAKRLKPTSQPIHVLWLGQIVLRKGIPYLFEAARELASTNIRFTVAGRIGISQKGLSSAPANVSILGKVPRQQALDLMAQADVFVLPTMSDGFALTQLEAMSFGLPVITTPNCGEVVEEGVNGLIVPAGSAAALAEAIRRLDADRSLLQAMSINALATPNQERYTLAHYAQAAQDGLESVLHPSEIKLPSAAR
jgi:glycosyltransferase involved in cell wall biosynthesis